MFNTTWSFKYYISTINQNSGQFYIKFIET